MPNSVNKCNTNYFNINLYYMEFSQNQYNMLFLVIISFILFVTIFKWIDYLTNENYIVEATLPRAPAFRPSVECFTTDVTQEKYDGSTSHTVDLPLTTSYSCKNFCGPKSQCAITREQCTSDIDCQGCNPGPKPEEPCTTEAVPPYDNGGKLGQQGLQYSPLTTGYNNHNADFAELYPGAKDAELTVPYQGLDLWTKSFNEGLKLYNKSRESADEYSEGISNAIPLASKGKMPFYEAKYPMTVSATGQFYQTTPPASNSTLSS